MREIHPDYLETTVTCGCGNTFVTRSTKTKIQVELCSQCHPFYTGKQKLIDSAGMVEKFAKRWTSGDAQKKANEHAERQSKADVRGRAADKAARVLKGEVKLTELEKHFPKPKSNLPPEPPLPTLKPDDAKS